MRKIVIVLFILSLTVIFAQRDKKIKGNGNVVTIDRLTSDYDALQVGGQAFNAANRNPINPLREE